MGAWLKTMAAEPIHVGSPHNKANAEMTLAQFRAWGWDARMEVFDVLYPTPKEVSLELVSGAGAPFRATLTEPPIPGDETSTRTRDQLPAYVAFQGDGDVTAPLVYVAARYARNADEMFSKGFVSESDADLRGTIVVSEGFGERPGPQQHEQ